MYSYPYGRDQTVGIGSGRENNTRSPSVTPVIVTADLRKIEHSGQTGSGTQLSSLLLLGTGTVGLG
jgi:hypothetical protein